MNAPAGRGPVNRQGFKVVAGGRNGERPRAGGTWSPWWAVVGVLTHFVVRQACDGWLNQPSDAKFFGALALVVLPLLFAGFALYRSVRSKPFR